MKLEVWTGPEPKEEKPTRVRLIEDGLGIVGLYVVDADGHRAGGNSRIGCLSNKGLHRCEGLSHSHGFPIGDRGRILDV